MASSIWPRPLRTADSLIQKGRIHMLCIGLSPSIDKDCRALILGSMPGVKSLEEQQYYAHPQNRFWPMMADLLGEALPSRYEEKLAMLLDHHIALWDSIGQCEREGSLDSAIREERGNDFTALLHPASRHRLLRHALDEPGQRPLAPAHARRDVAKSFDRGRNPLLY